VTEPAEPSHDEEGEQGVVVHCQTGIGDITTHQIVRAAEAAIGAASVRSLSIAVVDDQHIAELHERYMQDASPTDVLSFDLRDDPDDNQIEGEVVVSAETASRQGPVHGASEADELMRYVIHGILHLKGFDDRTSEDQQAMRQEEDRVLAMLRNTDNAHRENTSRT
jgi:probable rRNA maturation factor